MISAFGVDHGISKAYRKLEPKLRNANAQIQHANPNGRTQTLHGRFQENYSQWRHSAGQTGGTKLGRMMGKPGASSIKSAQGAKEGARAMVTGIGNINRAKRFLP